jgi:hypothetical protein
MSHFASGASAAPAHASDAIEKADGSAPATITAETVTGDGVAFVSVTVSVGD